MATAVAPRNPQLDVGRGLKFVFEDPEWVKKILMGAVFVLLSIFIIGGVFVAGYMVRLIRRTAAGEARPLPDWDDLGGIFSDGLRAFAVYLGHILAVLAVPVVLGGALFVMAFGLATLTHRSVGEAVGTAVGLVGVVLYGLTMLLMLAVTVYVPAALARFAATNDLKAAFQVRDNIAWIRANLGNYAMALLLYLIGSFAAQFGILLCCVGIFPVSFWSMCLLGWGLGEVLRLESLPR
jgi:hypothetical protein